MSKKQLFDHIAPPLSDLEKQIVKTVPPGGNWKDIPDRIIKKSKRLQNIKKSGGRTTYYGRMEKDQPSYTVNTYFHRVGNGSFMHPEQDRMASMREAARLQSFPDSFKFHGTKTSKYKQIGNAVPPLVALALSKKIKAKRAIDLFSGAGGLSLGFKMNDTEIALAVDKEKYFCETHEKNFPNSKVICGDINDSKIQEKIIEEGKKEVDLIMGGPPCQGFSTAGNWDKDDPRDNLFKPFLNIIKSIQPENVLIENVRGIMYKKDGAALEEINKFLHNLNYNTEIMVIKAEAFGVPQKRRRVLIAGSKKEKDLMPKPLFQYCGRTLKKPPHNEPANETLPKPVTVWEAISDLPELKPGQGEEYQNYKSKPKSEYQKFLRGHKTFKDFYKIKIS